MPSPISGKFIALRALLVPTLLFATLLALLPAAGAAGPRPNDPDILIPLEPLGFGTPSARLLTGAGTLFTLNFVDNTHLLFTFYNHNLIARLPDGEPDDYDGNVTAQLLELPSGKVLAQTEWRVRDHDPYLWSIGHGRFLRRVRSHLTLFDPVGGLARGNAFQEEFFGDIKRRIGYIGTSPTGDLLALETVPPRLNVVEDAATARRLPVEIFFYRLLLDHREGEPERLIHQSAGVVSTSTLIAIPADSDGFLSAVKDGPAVYNFDFHSHAGGPARELAAFDTTCPPRTHFVSRSDFIAFGCHGSADRQEIGGFNLKGENPWVEVIGGKDLGPTIIPAPAAGRFAITRVLVASTVMDERNLLPEEVQGQEVIVRQSHDGHTVLKTTASPVQRAGQNVDLSPDGLSLAVVRDGSIAVFHLPLLNRKDEAALKLAQAMAPPATQARIRLNPAAVLPENADTPADVSEPTAVPVSAPSNAATTEPSKAQEIVGDVPPERRAPPSLYTPDHPRQPGDPAPVKSKPQ